MRLHHLPCATTHLDAAATKPVGEHEKSRPTPKSQAAVSGTTVQLRERVGEEAIRQVWPVVHEHAKPYGEQDDSQSDTAK